MSAAQSRLHSLVVESRSRLLDLDADLGNAVQDPLRRRQAFRSVTATVLGLVAAETLDIDLVAGQAPLGTLLLEGFLVRETITSGRISADLLGPDDLVLPTEVEQHTSLLRCTTRWTALTTVRLALLDGQFARRSAQWPEIGKALIQRAARPGNRLVSAHAIATLPSIDMRLLASLWEWAAHWGFVGSSGVRLRLPLSHSRIGHLIGAQRPTVTATLGRLREQGLVEQLGGGDWLLHPSALEHPSAGAAGLRMPMLEDPPKPPHARGPRRPAAPTARAAEPAARLALAGSSADSVRALQLRLAEQRQTLGIVSARHGQMLARLQRESGQLRVNSETLSRLTRRSPGDPIPGEPLDRHESDGTVADLPVARARDGEQRP
jgi:CRP/FNR family transcriptional regulator, cyclic AMP receptor protein